MIRLISSIAWFAAGAAASACCDSTVRDVAFESTQSYLVVGDTLSVTVNATSGSAPLQSCHLYSSRERPTAFTFSASDTGVTTTASPGVFVARKTGDTRITAATAGVRTRYPLKVGVSPQIRALILTLEPLTPHVGDTVQLRVRSLDAAGGQVSDAYVVVLLRHSLDSVATFVDSPLARTPFVVRLRARKPGRVVLEAQQQRWSSLRRLGIQDSVATTILPRGDPESRD